MTILRTDLVLSRYGQEQPTPSLGLDQNSQPSLLNIYPHSNVLDPATAHYSQEGGYYHTTPNVFSGTGLDVRSRIGSQ